MGGRREGSLITLEALNYQPTGGFVAPPKTPPPERRGGNRQNRKAARQGAFLACSFWLVQALALVGRKSDAEKLFSKLLRLRNDVGLLSEEYDTRTRQLTGNFPQALSHISLVNAAFHLDPQPEHQRRG